MDHISTAGRLPITRATTNTSIRRTEGNSAGDVPAAALMHAANTAAVEPPPTWLQHVLQHISRTSLNFGLPFVAGVVVVPQILQSIAKSQDTEINPAVQSTASALATSFAVWSTVKGAGYPTNLPQHWQEAVKKAISDGAFFLVGPMAGVANPLIEGAHIDPTSWAATGIRAADVALTCRIATGPEIQALTKLVPEMATSEEHQLEALTPAAEQEDAEQSDAPKSAITEQAIQAFANAIGIGLGTYPLFAGKTDPASIQGTIGGVTTAIAGWWVANRIVDGGAVLSNAMRNSGRSNAA
jgi:hypothetical protein